MALLAEEIVQEWLNRHGFFTIRGARAGASEIDILAVRPGTTGLICRHFEVQASSNPIGYVCPPTKAAHKSGQGRLKVRTPALMKACVDEWCEKKYFAPRTVGLREKLAPGPWQLELVVHRVKYSEELDYVRKRGIVIHRLDDIVEDVLAGPHLLSAAAGGSLIELVELRTLR